MRQVRVGSMELTPAHKAAVMKVLSSNQLSPGKTCREFEKKFAHAHGAKHGLFVNSGTDALRIALLAMKEKYKWPDGSKVAVPALTFVASVNTILQANLTPLFIDVSPNDFNLDPSLLEAALERNAKAVAVMPVHLFGNPCDVAWILRLARKYGLRVIEDSCEMMGVSKIWGDVACYSTYVCHLISTGVGGLATTNDSTLSALMRSYANHGRNINYLPGTQASKDIAKRFQFDRIGYSARSTEVEAALGIVELDFLQKHIRRRQEVATRLFYALDSISDFFYVQLNTGAHMMFPVVLWRKSHISKWSLCKFLEKNGIETREMLPLINQPCYKKMNIRQKDFPVASWVNNCGFYIGCHPGMTDDDVSHVIETFRRFFNG